MSKITIVEERLETLEVDWRALYSASGSDNPFLCWEWVRFWGEVFGDAQGIYVLVARQGELVVGIASFQLSESRLSFYGDPFFADYAGFLLLPGYEQAGHLLINKVLKTPGWGVASLEPIRSISNIVPLLDKELENEKVHWSKDTICYNPRVNTTRGFDEYWSGLAKKLRQEIRTTENHLVKMGGWKYRCAADTEFALEIYQELVRFHMNRQSGKSSHSIFSEDENVSFFAELICTPMANLKPHLSCIELDGRIVSAAYSLQCCKTLYYWIPSFDSSVRSVSLGKLHIKCLLESCFADDIVWLDFMGGDESYKYQWAVDEYQLYRYRIYRNKLAGIAANLHLRSRESLKRVHDQSTFLQVVRRRLSKIIG